MSGRAPMEASMQGTLKTRPAPAAPSPAPAGFPKRPDPPRYDLVALAAEAAEDRSYDEAAKVRVTQQDIRKLLERRRKDPK